MNVTTGSDDWIDTLFNIRDDSMEALIKRDPTWSKNNMEYDLRTTDWILAKVKHSDIYAQHLYAAMCNNDFQKMDNWVILNDETWSRSWRSAGGIIADMRENGEGYLSYYCSGMKGSQCEIGSEEFNLLTDDQKQGIINSDKYVSESVVTDEVREDLLKIGWVVLESKDELY